jgi:uncharacterized protein YlxW (UPF0749 family)
MLAGAISAHSVSAAPVGLAVTISAAALAGTAVTTSTLIAATAKTIAMTTLQKTLVTVTVAVLAGAGIYETRQAAQLRDKVQTLQQQQTPMAEQVQQLQNNFADETNRLMMLMLENARLKSNSNQTELLKLRGQVGVLQGQINSLKNNLTASQTNSTFAEAAMQRWLDTDVARQDLSMAMIGYAKSHNGLLPLSFSELIENMPGNTPTIQMAGDKFDFLVNIPTRRAAASTNGSLNSGVILFRERGTRQKQTNLSAPPDGVRIYGFTDGSIVEVSTGWLKSMGFSSFEDWEREHMITN